MNTNRKAQQRSASRPEGQRVAEKGRQSNRIPLGQHRRKMTVDPELKKRIEREGYVLRWINDDGKVRIQQAKEAGYTFVRADGLEKIGDSGDQNSDPGGRISQIVGTCEDGSPMRAYLMAIKREWHEEDQQAKQQEVDQIDKAIREGRSAPSDNQYVPREGIRYQP
jgi:hypothetical protein